MRIDKILLIPAFVFLFNLSITAYKTQAGAQTVDAALLTPNLINPAPNKVGNTPVAINPTIDITWSNVLGSKDNMLSIGSEFGKNDIYSVLIKQNEIKKKTINFNNSSLVNIKSIPKNRVIYLRLFVQTANDDWIYEDFVYKIKSEIKITAYSNITGTSYNPNLKLYLNKTYAGITLNILPLDENNNTSDYYFYLDVPFFDYNLVSFVFDNNTCGVIDRTGKCTGTKHNDVNRDIYIREIKIDGRTAYSYSPIAKDLEEMKLFSIKYDRSNREDNTLYKNINWGNTPTGFWDGKGVSSYPIYFTKWNGAVNIGIK